MRLEINKIDNGWIIIEHGFLKNTYYVKEKQDILTKVIELINQRWG